MLQVPGKEFGLRGEVLSREDWNALLPAWEELSREAAEDNVYYAPRYALPLLRTVDRKRDIAFAVVWRGAKLVALLPFTRRKLAFLRGGGRAWHTKYSFSCMPLLDRQNPSAAAAVLLDVLASLHSGEWIIPTVNVPSDACVALTGALARKGLPFRFTSHFQRAVLEADSDFETHMKRHVSAHRRKDLARNRRRLEQLGAVGHEAHIAGDGLARAVSAFLEIEAKGWKGKRGTALACHEATRQFATDAFTGDERSSICRADVLTLNGAPVAVSLIVFARGTGFTVKCTYDEAYRSCSVGLLLELEVIRSFLSEKWARRLDSATAGAHVIDGLWPGRVEVADLIFSLSPKFPALRLAALETARNAKRQAKTSIKSWLA